MQLKTDIIWIALVKTSAVPDFGSGRNPALSKSGRNPAPAKNPTGAG